MKFQPGDLVKLENTLFNGKAEGTIVAFKGTTTLFSYGPLFCYKSGRRRIAPPISKSIGQVNVWECLFGDIKYHAYETSLIPIEEVIP